MILFQIMKSREYIFKSAALAAGIAGIVINIYVCPRYGELFSYYTLQSNMICILYLGYLLLCGILKKRLFSANTEAVLRGGFTVCITFTFLIYHFMLRSPDLSPGNFTDINVISDIFVHYIFPAAVILDYLIFSEKGKFKFYFPFLWLALPLLYLCYVSIYSAAGGRFIVEGKISEVPYFFLDKSAVGRAGVMLWTAAIAAGYMILSFILVAADRIAGKHISSMRS